MLFSQAAEICEQRSLQVVGYYQANELVDDMELGPFGKKLCDKIRTDCPTPAVLLVTAAAPKSTCLGTCAHLPVPDARALCVLAAQLDGVKMHPSPSDLRLVALNLDGKKSGVTPSVEPDAEGALKHLDGCIDAGVQQQLVDFDAHLDDPTKDWTANATLLAR